MTGAVAGLFGSTLASGQAATIEVTQSAGYSTEEVGAAATQVRAFGRRPGLDLIVRGQVAAGPVVAGVSHIDTSPYQPASYAFGRAVFTGVDVRWMHAGVQVRGEWIAGRPFEGTTTTGGYVDLIVHRPRMGPVTAVARAERLDDEAPPPFELRTHRYTAGARIRLLQALTLQMALVRQPPQLPPHRSAALDVGITYSIRRD